MNNVIILVAGPESEKRDCLIREMGKRYADMTVLPADNPESIFWFRTKYDGNASIYTVLVADKEDFPVWHEVNDTADLACNSAESLADMLSEIDDILNKRNSELRQWILTDSDCSQYILAHNRNVYDCVQVQALPDDRFGVATMTVDLSEYSSDEKLDVLASYGYEWASLQRALPDSDAMRTLAECMFETEALQNIDEVYTTYAEAKDKVEHFRRQHSDMYAEDEDVTIKELEPKWVSYSDERELWLRPLEPMFPSDFEVVRATPSFLHYGEWAFTHRFIHLSDYRLNDEFDARILNRDGNMDETTLEIAGVEHIMAGEDGKPDRINDPNYILDYALLAAMIADDESGAQYMSEEQAMALVDKIVGTDRWKL